MHQIRISFVRAKRKKARASRKLPTTIARHWIKWKSFRIVFLYVLRLKVVVAVTLQIHYVGEFLLRHAAKVRT